jgi:hypothetical protein
MNVRHHAPKLATTSAVVALSVGLSTLVAFAARSQPDPARAASPVASASPAPPAVAVPDLVAAKAKQIAAHRAAVEAHARAPVDPEWSRATEGKLRDALAPLAAASRFAVESVDCRTTTCVAVLAFPSYEDARAGWQSVLTHRNGPRCAVEVTLDDPADPSQRYELAFVYQCPNPRAGAVPR